MAAASQKLTAELDKLNRLKQHLRQHVGPDVLAQLAAVLRETQASGAVLRHHLYSSGVSVLGCTEGLEGAEFITGYKRIILCDISGD